MNLQHRSASFRGTCIVAPRHPKTRLPTTAIERKSFEYPAVVQVGESEKNSSGYEVNMKTSQGNISTSKSFSGSNTTPVKKKKRASNSVQRSQSLKIDNSVFDPQNSVEIKNLRYNDDQFFHKLKTLKEENKRALQSLEKLYNFSVDAGKDKYKDLTKKTVTTGFSKNLFNGNGILSSKNHIKHHVTRNHSRDSSENHCPESNVDFRSEPSIRCFNGDVSADLPNKNHIHHFNRDCVEDIMNKNDIKNINGDTSEYFISENHIDHTNVDDAKDSKSENQDQHADTDAHEDLNFNKGTCSSYVGSRKQSDLVNGGDANKNNGDFIADMNKKAWEQIENEDLSDKSSDDELDEKLKVKPPENHTNILPEENEYYFRGRTSSYDVIANMWDNFSVDEVVPYNHVRKSILDESDWSPSITIQEPFKMTLREEKNKKVKERKIERIKDELLQKRLKEEAETRKRIIPTPVPPSTFLPMYGELQAQQQQKKQYTKEISKHLLKSTEKPFSFLKREEAKDKIKHSSSTSVVVNKSKLEKKKALFKANPFPDKLFDLTLADKLAEQEEYRKIKNKLRSEELLASSSLPPSMKTRNLRYYQAGPKTKQIKAELRKRKEKSFHPMVHHDIPDYEEMQKKIEMAIETRKNLNTPTICEPFNLHTANVPSRRSKFKESTEKAKIDNIQSLNKIPNSNLARSNSLGRSNTATRNNTLRRSGSFQFGRSSRSNSESNSPVVYGLTEAARLRHEHIHQSLDRQEQEKIKQNIENRKKQKDLSKLKKVVAKKATVHDPTRYREKEIAEKLESFRQADQHRNHQYKEFLQSIDQKNEQRPLLFERESQTNAKRQAEKRYEEILRNAGIEGKMLDSFRFGPHNSYEFNTYGDQENAKEHDNNNVDSEENDSWDDNELQSEYSKGYEIVTKHNGSEENNNGSDDEVDVENYVSDEMEMENDYNNEVESNDGSYTP